jgi:putative glycosyltransferase (TIGR04372 family)
MKKLTIIKLYYPISLAVICFLRLIRPFIRIRLTAINESRIGLIARDVHINRLKSLDWSMNHIRRDVVIYAVPNRNSANKFLSQMFQRETRFVTGNFGASLYHAATKINDMILTTEHVPDFDGLLTKHSILPKFTSSELKDGDHFLESVGCVGDRKFVCLLVRDNSYIRNRFPSKFDGYTSYRNSEISTYIEAAEALGDLGFHVFRMGSDSENALESKHPNVIDYARNGMRSEFLDIFLSAHCTFFISTGSGLDEVPKIFRRPLTYLNLQPLGSDLNYTDVLVYPKILRDATSNAPLTLREIAERDLQFAYNVELYDLANVLIDDMTSEEVLAVTLETVARVNGSWAPNSQYIKSEESLRNIFNAIPELRMRPEIDKPPTGKLAACFLDRYPNFLN